MKKRIWNKVVSIMTAILLIVGLVPSTTVAVMAATVQNITYLDGEWNTTNRCQCYTGYK